MNNDFEFQTACIESLLNIEQAFVNVDKCGGEFGGWSLSKKEIRSFALHVLSTCSVPNIVELGGGWSTLFWVFLAHLKNNFIKVTTFEHHPGWGNHLKKVVLKSPDVEVHLCSLRQISDQEWNTLFTFPAKARNTWSSMGSLVSLSECENTRIHNAFYDIPFQVFPLVKSIDAMVVDGPHGNGRSLAYPLFFECLKPDAWLLIDDIEHCSFVDDLAKLFRFKIVKKELPSNDKRWVLLRLEGKI